MDQDESLSSFGFPPHIAAGLASAFLGVGGLVILSGQPRQQWVRFVAAQSIVMLATYIGTVISLAVFSLLLAFVPGLNLLVPLIWLVEVMLWCVFFVAWIVMTVKAFQGSVQRFPVISHWTDSWVPASASR